jgi:hypothetical protein
MCEYCYIEVVADTMPEEWDLIFQSYLCPTCIARAKKEHPHDWLYVVKCGEYSNGKPDPRQKR